MSDCSAGLLHPVQIAKEVGKLKRLRWQFKIELYCLQAKSRFLDVWYCAVAIMTCSFCISLQQNWSALAGSCGVVKDVRVHVPVEASLHHLKSMHRSMVVHGVEVSGNRLTLPVCFYATKAAAVVSCKQELLHVIKFFNLQWRYVSSWKKLWHKHMERKQKPKRNLGGK